AGGLDPGLTSPYQFYQFWVNTDDRDVQGYRKLFSLKPRDAITALIERAKKDPAAREAQRTLAAEVTELIHGDAARNAMVASDILFGRFDPRQASGRVLDTLAQEIPTTTIDGQDALTLVDALVRSGLAKSKSEARRATTCCGPSSCSRGGSGSASSPGRTRSSRSRSTRSRSRTACSRWSGGASSSPCRTGCGPATLAARSWSRCSW